MIIIDTISIREFRGIREIDLAFGSKNFGICGSNGTGKSGVVDAIEFGLTGDITRLSGQGTADLSVAKHGPHVDVGEKSEKSSVTISGRIPSIDKQVSITRTLKNPKKPIINPPDGDVLAAFDDIVRHPEFALSRREIAKYVMTPAGQRAQDVQNLLRLGEIEKIRKALTTAAGKERREADAAISEHNRARDEFTRSLSVEGASPELVLGAINERRTQLGLTPLSELTATTSLIAGLDEVSADGDEAQKQPKVVKSVAKADLDAVFSAEGATPAAREAVRSSLEELSANLGLFRLVRQQTLIQTGLALVDDEACPLCDLAWDEAELKAYLEAKLEQAGEGKAFLADLQAAILPLKAEITDQIADIAKAKKYATDLDLAEGDSALALDEYSTSLDQLKATLESAISNVEGLSSALEALSQPWLVAPDSAVARIDEVRSAIAALPDPSTETKARDELKLAHDRYVRSVTRRTEAVRKRGRASLSAKVLEHFNNSATVVLNGLYDAVADDFSSYYRQINKGDEDAFTGKLLAEPAKLSLNVDFYGRGQFPPGAYHSEGHQDGMGLCLYLALMKHTLGDAFRFCVLDDVLMSVDAGHRREVCRLLKSEFPSTQFVLTTHDRVWLQYMRTEGLITRSETFGGWSVDTGPRVWKDKDVWSDINHELDAQKVSVAAALLRRYLEHIAHALCDGLKAGVKFRGDGQYTLGDLFPPALSQILKDLKQARQAAQSWGDSNLEEECGQAVSDYQKLWHGVRVEDWTVNPAVHYNAWANFEPEEFREVANAFERLLEFLQCGVCGSLLYASFNGIQREQLRCTCGKQTFNLIAKKAGLD